MKEFIEKLIGRLEEYKDSHLIEHDSEECLHCQENEDDWCNCRDCSICVWDKAVEIVNQLAEEYNKREFYEITLNGCDDNTTFVMAMTELEHEFLIRVSQKANETSTYGCMPRLYVEKAEMIVPKGE